MNIGKHKKWHITWSLDILFFTFLCTRIEMMIQSLTISWHIWIYHLGVAILHTELCTSYALCHVVQSGCLVTSGSDYGVGKCSNMIAWIFAHTQTCSLFIWQIWTPKLLQACFAAITDYATYNLGKRVINQTIAPYIVCGVSTICNVVYAKCVMYLVAHHPMLLVQLFHRCTYSFKCYGSHVHCIGTQLLAIV